MNIMQSTSRQQHACVRGRASRACVPVRAIPRTPVAAHAFSTLPMPFAYNDEMHDDTTTQQLQASHRQQQQHHRQDVIISGSSGSSGNALKLTLPVTRVQGVEKQALQRMLHLARVASDNPQTLTEAVRIAGLTVVATSSMRASSASNRSAPEGSVMSVLQGAAPCVVLATDSFEDYEDMQGVPLDPRAQMSRYLSQIPGLSSAEVAGPGMAWTPMAMSPHDTTLERLTAQRHHAAMIGPDPSDPAWNDHIQADASIEEHSRDIDMYGDGGAVNGLQTRGPTGADGLDPASALLQAASRVRYAAGPVVAVAGTAARVTGKAAAKAYAKVTSAISGNKMAAAAASVLQSSGLPQSSWVVLDDAAGATRMILLTAGVDACHAVKVRDNLVPFEGNQNARISPALQLEARHLFMQLTPVVMDAADQGMHVRFTGLGAGGSLAAVLALMCAHHGVGSSLEAVAFDAPACIGEVAEDAWCDVNGCSTQDEQEMLEEIMVRGLLSDMGLPQSLIRNVQLDNQQQQQRGSGSAAAAAAGSVMGSVRSPRLMGLLGDLAASLSLPGVMSSAAGALASVPAVAAAVQQQPASAAATMASVKRSQDGKHMTVFKPLGLLVALDT